MKAIAVSSSRSAHRRVLAASWLFLTLLAGGLAPAADAQTFTNPLGVGADPKILYQGGYYYTVQGSGTHMFVFRSSSLASLLTESPPTIITNSSDTFTWAPEIHFINGKFYIYAAVDTGIRVIEADSGSGPWTTKAILGSGGWIDPSILQLSDGSLYMLFSNYPSISIVALSNPWTVSGSSTQLSSATYGWEGSVNENPTAIIHDNKVYVTYSANAWNTGNYAVGMLSAPVTSNLLSAGVYTKSANPVFSSSATAGVYGPGGNCFFKSPDGTEDWLCYHAYAASNGLAGGAPRSIRAQKFGWNSDGSPNLGTPVAAGISVTLPSGDPGVGQQNYAIGASAFASTQWDSSYAPARAIDGSIGTADSGGWSPLASDTLSWLEVDLGQARAITSVEFVTRQGIDQPASRQNFELWGSNDRDMSISHTVLGTRGADGLPYQGTGTSIVTGSQSFRYIAAVKTTPGYFFAAELRALGGALPNIALNRPTSASSQWSDEYASARAADGEYNVVDGGWSAAAVTSDPQPWWQIDLGSAQVLGKIDVTMRQGTDQPETRRNFEIWASNSADMSNHVTLGAVGSTELPYGGTYSVSPTATTAYRYVRVRKTASEYFFLSEVKVYAK